MVRQEIYGYLLTHYAIAALICGAATEADIDPDPLLAKYTHTDRDSARCGQLILQGFRMRAPEGWPLLQSAHYR
jgi:hypothetical protein